MDRNGTIYKPDLEEDDTDEKITSEEWAKSKGEFLDSVNKCKGDGKIHLN